MPPIVVVVMNAIDAAGIWSRGFRRSAKSKTLQPLLAPFDFKAFSDELREMSVRYGVKLISLGAMSGLDAGGDGTTWLAIWSDGSGKNQRD
jgi:hypothetical protein